MIPTSFTQLIGNAFVKECLQRMINKKAIGHALLFAGPDGIGKSLFAQAVAAGIMQENDVDGKHLSKIAQGTHPDIHVLKPEGKLGMHSIQALRQMCEEVHLPPYEANCKFFIIHEADRMLTYSANALLKTFEEPPPHTIIILLSHSQTALLPTILSRCSTFFFQAISQQDIHAYLRQHYPGDENQLQTWAGLAQGSIGRAVQLAKRGGDPNRGILLEAFSKGKFESHKALSDLAKQLAEEIEAGRKAMEEESKEMRQVSADMTAVQQEAMEKEIEGASAMILQREMGALFGVLLSWYRDLHLLQIGGRGEYLMNPDYEEALEQSLQMGEGMQLEKVQQAIAAAKLGLQRSVPAVNCLENLFLKLERI